MRKMKHKPSTLILLMFVGLLDLVFSGSSSEPFISDPEFHGVYVLLLGCGLVC